jgi:hypothetical protein
MLSLAKQLKKHQNPKLNSKTQTRNEETTMKTLIIITLLLTTGCGGYNVIDDGLLGAPLGTGFYWAFGADKAHTTGGSSAETVNVIDWTARH